MVVNDIHPTVPLTVKKTKQSYISSNWSWLFWGLFIFVAETLLLYSPSLPSAETDIRQLTTKTIYHTSNYAKIIPACNKTSGHCWVSIIWLFRWQHFSADRYVFCKVSGKKNPSILKHLEQDLLFLLLKAHVTGAGILCQSKGEGWMQREQRKPQSTGTVPKSEEHGKRRSLDTQHSQLLSHTPRSMSQASHVLLSIEVHLLWWATWSICLYVSPSDT